MIGVSSIAAIVFMLNQRFGSAVNLNIHLHCLILDGVHLRARKVLPMTQRYLLL